MAEDALFDVEQVGGAEGEAAAADAFQGLGVAPHDPANGVLGGVMLVADESLDLGNEDRVLHQLSMGLEDGPVLPAELVIDGLLVVLGLVLGVGQGAAKAVDLLGQLVVGDVALGDAEPFGVQHQSRPDGHAGRNRNTAFNFHEAA